MGNVRLDGLYSALSRYNERGREQAYTIFSSKRHCHTIGCNLRRLKNFTSDQYLEEVWYVAYAVYYLRPPQFVTGRLLRRETTLAGEHRETACL